MKKVVLLSVMLTTFFNVSMAQDVELFKGYVGIKMGPVFPLGRDISKSCGIGAQFDFNFGYLFSESFGITALVFGTAFPVTGSSATIGLSGLMIGPLWSKASESGKVEFDIKPTIGYGRGIIISGGETSSSSTTFVAGIGTSVRWNCWRRVSLSANVDCFYGSPDSINLSSLSVSVGAHYRLR